MRLSLALQPGVKVLRGEGVNISEAAHGCGKYEARKCSSLRDDESGTRVKGMTRLR